MVNIVIPVDLHEFGVDGVAEIGNPTFRKRNELNNSLSKYYKGGLTSDGRVDMNAIVDTIKLGDLEVLQTLVYVKKAPFPTDLDGFMGFCDDLDEKNNGSAAALFFALKEAIQKLEEGPGPLESSP